MVLFSKALFYGVQWIMEHLIGIAIERAVPKALRMKPSFAHATPTHASSSRGFMHSITGAGMWLAVRLGYAAVVGLVGILFVTGRTAIDRTTAQFKEAHMGTDNGQCNSDIQLTGKQRAQCDAYEAILESVWLSRLAATYLELCGVAVAQHMRDSMEWVNDGPIGWAVWISVTLITTVLMFRLVSWIGGLLSGASTHARIDAVDASRIFYANHLPPEYQDLLRGVPEHAMPTIPRTCPEPVRVSHNTGARVTEVHS